MLSIELRNRLFDTAVADCLRAVSGGSLVGANILALCLIDYAAKLRNKISGPRTAGVNYRAFVDDFLKPINAGYVGADFWWFRCALVHTYAMADAAKDTTIRGYAMMHRNPAIHLSKPGPPTLYLNADTFVADVVLAVDAFLTAVNRNTAVEAAADDLLIVSIAGTPVGAKRYHQMHHALAAFDATPFDETRFRDDVTALYPT